ncbi:hypothetical protein INR49_022786 [Caranx melampygus]|nr:hypothetical protein INR49_022786 [Caranx melampygus]
MSYSNRCSCSAWSRCSFLSLQLCSRWLRAACSRSSRDDTLGATLWKSAPPDSQLPWLPPPPPSLEASPCEGPRRIRWSKLRPSRSRASTGAVAMVLRRRPCSSRSLQEEKRPGMRFSPASSCSSWASSCVAAPENSSRPRRSSVHSTWSYSSEPPRSEVSWEGSTSRDSPSTDTRLVCREGQAVYDAAGTSNTTLLLQCYFKNTSYYCKAPQQYCTTGSTVTSKLSLALPRLVLCFCQNVSGLMSSAVWMLEENDSCSVLSTGFTLSHLLPRMSTTTVKPRARTSSLRDRWVETDRWCYSNPEMSLRQRQADSFKETASDTPGPGEGSWEAESDLGPHTAAVRMESVEEAVVSELKQQLEDEELNPEQKIHLLNSSINKALNMAAVQTHSSALTRVKSQLYHAGVLSQCVHALKQEPRILRGHWSAAATLAQLTSSCCVGLDPGEQSKAFHRLFLPSVMDCLLSLASQLMRRAECSSLFRKVMDAVGWLLRAHTQLTTQVLSSVHYEQIQMCDDEAVSLLCVQLWIQTCTGSRDFLSGLSDDSVLLLLNEAVGQLAVSSDSAVGGASVKLILLMANQLQPRLQPLLLRFRGLDNLLHKDWRGRGFDQDVDQLITLIRSGRGRMSPSQVSAEHVRAACVIQAAWRSYQTRRRVKSLSRAVTALQRRYRARRMQQQRQKEAQQWEEELKYQVCLRRQQARRAFHQKQRQLLQLLPPDQVQSYLQECERRAAVVIQSYWRGFRERRRYNDTLRHTLRETHTRQEAARTLQRAVRRFLQERQAAKAPPLAPFWIGQKGLTDSRRAELKEQVEAYISVHRSSRVSPEDCERLHEEVQLLLQSELQRGSRGEGRSRDAPPLSVITAADAESFLSPSGPIAAQARDAHNAMLQAARLPWWRMLGEPADTFSPAHSQELEAEFGGLFVGGSVKVSKLT